MGKTIIWDLDNTLYFETDEYKNKLNEATAEAAIKEFNLPLGFQEATDLVKESYSKYRDGVEHFVRTYGLSNKELYEAYHKYKTNYIGMITPYEGLLESLKSLDCPQYIFSTSTKDICIRILKHIGLYEFFKDKIYSVEDFDVYKKNESSWVYQKVCDKIGVEAKDCIFVDDSYSNHKFAKEAGMTTVRLYYNNNSAKGMDFIDSAYKGIEETIKGLKEDYMC
ncbi:MAG: HAD family hydrolase [Alphaproteobacteria bacterium]|nr:HAD family hydrolase [Alphaproteobacteria bacterium]